MPGEIEARMEVLGIELPVPSEPGGSYVPYHFSGNLLFLTGQLCHGTKKGTHLFFAAVKENKCVPFFECNG